MASTPGFSDRPLNVEESWGEIEEITKPNPSYNKFTKVSSLLLHVEIYAAPRGFTPNRPVPSARGIDALIKSIRIQYPALTRPDRAQIELSALSDEVEALSKYSSLSTDIYIDTDSSSACALVKVSLWLQMWCVEWAPGASLTLGVIVPPRGPISEEDSYWACVVLNKGPGDDVVWIAHNPNDIDAQIDYEIHAAGLPCYPLHISRTE